MERYLNLVWKNYTASLSQNSNENFLDEQDDDLLADNDLRSKIPFWIGAIVISLFFISAIIATIRYCCYTLCSSNTETEKVALMSPSSPCLSSSVANTIQRQIPNPPSHHSSDNNKTLSSSPGQSQDHHLNTSITPIIRHHTEIESDDSENHYFSPTEIASTRASVDFRKKVHDIYILPVSPALSSSSSIINTDDVRKTGSNTMPVRSRRYLSPSANIHHNLTNRGVKNNCFTESPQPKDRTLPRSYGGTLRDFQPPSQPPPLPPTIAQIHFNHNDKSTFQHQSTSVDSDNIGLRFNTISENPMKKALQPPPVPSRSQKPSVLSIGFEELIEQPDNIDFRLSIKSSPQDDYSEHTWPKPPESMSTSGINRASSIPYDHLIPTVIMRQNNTTKSLHQYRHNEQSMLTESET